MASSQASPYDDPSGQYDHQQGPARKKMRKGTKSCMECRRRKIKCNFEPGRTAICNECFARGTTCVDQEHGDVYMAAQPASSNDSASLKDRVSNLEDLIRQVLDRLPAGRESEDVEEQSIDHVETQAAEVLKSLRTPSQMRSALDETSFLPGGPRETAPALTLFDNEVIRRTEIPRTISREQYNKTKALNSALLQLLPPIPDLELILESSQEWWTIWKTMFPEITDRRCLTIKEAVSHTLRSEKPAEIAKIMLCIALSIHQLAPGFDWNQLSIKEKPSELMERYIGTVDRLITSDEEIAATIDGIECMILEAKWHINMGRPRRSWLLYQRAIAFSQLLGMHRLASRPMKDRDSLSQRQLMIWAHLVMGDRYLSLFLGLPYAIADPFCTPTLALAKQPDMPMSIAERYIMNMISVITKMIERNQNPQGSPYSATLLMDQELEQMRNQTESSWWGTERVPGATIEEHFERLQAQFFHHQARVLLHMPFMLKSSADKGYQYSHRATLESSREMIKYYDALRGSENIGPHTCKMIDFQAFTGAMLLLLNLIGYSQQSRGAVAQQPDLDQDQQDSALIDRTITLLHEAAGEAGGVVAAHSVHTLEMLARIRTGVGNHDDQACKGEAQISIPYFGTVSITKGTHFVPIKPGTYPEAGRAVSRSVNPQTGLPTPPSMCSNSTLPSPRDSLLNADHNQARQSPYWGSTASSSIDRSSASSAVWPPDNVNGNNNGNNLSFEDPCITFDSFMAFPTIESIDFSNMGPMTNNSSNNNLPTTSSAYMTGNNSSNNLNGQYGGIGSLEEQNMAAGFPFPVTNGGNVDLDHGWNWFGVGAPTQ